MTAFTPQLQQNQLSQLVDWQAVQIVLINKMVYSPLVESVRTGPH